MKQFETKLLIFFISSALILFKIFAPIREKQCVYNGELNRDQSMPTSFLIEKCETFSKGDFISHQNFYDKKQSFCYV